MSNSLKLPSAAISNHKGIQVRSRILHFHDVAPFFAFVPRTSLNGIPCPISTKWFIRPWVEEKRKPSLNIAYFFVSSVGEYSAAAFVKAGETDRPAWILPDLIHSIMHQSFWYHFDILLLYYGCLLWYVSCVLCVVCSSRSLCSVGHVSGQWSVVSGCLWSFWGIFWKKEAKWNLSFLLRHLFCLSLSISLCAKSFSLSLHK